MFFNKHKHIKNIKTKEDIQKAIEELTEASKELLESSDEVMYDTKRAVFKLDLVNSNINYETYCRNVAELDLNENLEDAISNSRAVTNDKGEKEYNINKYLEKEIRSENEKRLIDLDLQFGNIDYLEHELRTATLYDKPYAKIILSPEEDNTSQLEVSVRYNQKFVDQLIDKDQYDLHYDEEDNLITDDLVEQWFHSTIIVLAANTLKETDLETFRSVAGSDYPSVDLINEVQFDVDNMDHLSNSQKEKVNKLLNNKNIYR